MLIASWIARAYRAWATSAPTAQRGGSDYAAFGLFESADSLAGHDPHEARQLRSAAQAWLRVVR